MRKFTVTLFTLLSVLFVQAGNQCPSGGGSSNCTPSGTAQPGLGDYNAFHCITIGTVFTDYIQFKVPTSLYVASISQTVSVDSIEIVNLDNMPCGLCWASNHQSNKWAAGEYGCIKISGGSNDAVGLYKIDFLLNAKLPGTTSWVNGVHSSQANLAFYMRVINSGGNCAAMVDTTQPKLTASTSCPVGINELPAIASLQITPNPFTTSAMVTFYAENAGVYSEKMVDVIGRVVTNHSLQVKAGENTSLIEKATLPSGVYFYSLSDGKNTATRKIIIE